MNRAALLRNDLNMPTGERERKAYFTLAAQFALVGWELIKGDPEICGQAPYLACRQWHCKPLDSLDAAREHLGSLGQGQRAVCPLEAPETRESVGEP